MKIGLFGGSFDPVHLGHLMVARTAREEIGLDRLFFIPAAQSPFKSSASTAPGRERTRLLRLALAGWEWCSVDDVEVVRGGVSYTVETLRAYAAQFPHADLFFLIGGDHVAQLPQWREAATLAQLATFVVVPRPGEQDIAFPKPFRGRQLKGFPIQLSASEIRARIKANQSIEPLVPAAVAEAIRNNRLYL